MSFPLMQATDVLVVLLCFIPRLIMTSFIRSDKEHFVPVQVNDRNKKVVHVQNEERHRLYSRWALKRQEIVVAEMGNEVVPDEGLIWVSALPGSDDVRLDVAYLGRHGTHIPQVHEVVVDQRHVEPFARLKRVHVVPYKRPQGRVAQDLVCDQCLLALCIFLRGGCALTSKIRPLAV